MPTNSAFGWPIIVKGDMYKPSVQSALEGTAFDNRVNIERSRHEKNVASTAALPAVGDYLGQAVWVTNRNRPYYWNGSAWRSAGGFEVGNITLSSLSFPGNGGAFRWTASINVSLPAGRFSAIPYVFANMGTSAQYGTWAQVGARTTTSFGVRAFSTVPTPSSLNVQWAAFDSN